MPMPESGSFLMSTKLALLSCTRRFLLSGAPSRPCPPSRSHRGCPSPFPSPLSVSERVPRLAAWLESRFNLKSGPASRTDSLEAAFLCLRDKTPLVIKAAPAGGSVQVSGGGAADVRGERRCREGWQHREQWLCHCAAQARPPLQRKDVRIPAVKLLAGLWHSGSSNGFAWPPVQGAPRNAGAYPCPELKGCACSSRFNACRPAALWRLPGRPLR